MTPATFSPVRTRCAALLLACCGSSATPVGHSASHGPPAAMVAVPATSDVQVATVDGRPVWGGCVADQLRRTPTLSREAALGQCIDLELLAHAAEARNLAVEPEVVEATRTALVRRLTDAFEAQYPNPDSMREQIDEAYRKAGTTTRPELRASYFALIHVDKKASEAKHAAARRAAEQLYQRIAGETGLFPAHLEAAARGIEVGEGLKIELASYGAIPRDNRRTAPEYVGALFAIPEVGRVSSVVQTEFGYHVILLTELRPEAPVEREQVFGGLRRQAFLTFVAELMGRTPTEVHPELLEAAP